MKFSKLGVFILGSSTVFAVAHPLAANGNDQTSSPASDLSFSETKPDETVQTVNLIIKSMLRILGPQQTRPEFLCKYQKRPFCFPTTSVIRGPVDIAVDIEGIYWKMLKSEPVFGTAGCRLQDLLFERLLLPDFYIHIDHGEDSGEELGIDRILKQAYDLLYHEPANGPQISQDRRRRLVEVKRQLFHLWAPISQTLYTVPFQVDIDDLSRLYEFINQDVKGMTLAWSPHVSEERLVTDTLRGLKAILERVRQLAEK